MGATFSTQTQNIVNNVTGYVTGKKRKHSESDEEEVNKVIDIALHTPKRFVIKSPLDIKSIVCIYLQEKVDQHSEIHISSSFYGRKKFRCDSMRSRGRVQLTQGVFVSESIFCKHVRRILVGNNTKVYKH